MGISRPGSSGDLSAGSCVSGPGLVDKQGPRKGGRKHGRAMKQMYYASRFARPLSKADLQEIQDSAHRNNDKWEITGFLVSLGNTFFQVLEGPAATVDRLYYERIVPDERHEDVLCLKTELDVQERMFPGWKMKVFNLNEASESLPFAFRQILTSLVESHRAIAEYTQPSILKMVEQGISPTSVRPRRECVTVLYSDIIGFSRFAEHLAPRDLIGLVNSHAEVCSTHIAANNGQVNKLTGDGVLAYFPGLTSDDALEASLAILAEMARRRTTAGETSPHRYLYVGVGLAHGLVFEGNVGSPLKRDFTIHGNTVNLAARIESLTRDLNVRLNIDESVVLSAKREHPFKSLGKHQLKGQSKALELYTLGSLSSLDIGEVYQSIEDFVARYPEQG